MRICRGAQGPVGRAPACARASYPQTHLGVGFVRMRSHLRFSPEFRGGPISALTVLDRTRGVKENGRDPEDNRVGAFLRLCGPTGAGRRDPGAPPSLCGLGLVGADSPGLSPLSRASSLPRIPEGYLATASPEEAVLSQ